MSYFLIILGIGNLIGGLHNNPNMPSSQKIFHIIVGIILVSVGYLMRPNNLAKKFQRNQEEKAFKEERERFLNGEKNFFDNKEDK